MLRILSATILSASIAVAQLPYAETFLRGQSALDRGELEQAERELRAAFELEPLSTPCAYALSCAAAMRGDVTPALERLNHAVELGYLDADVARWDPQLRTLREEPEFKACVERMLARVDGQRYGLRSYDVEHSLGIRDLGPGNKAGEAFLCLTGGSLARYDASDLSLHEIQRDRPDRSIDAPLISEDGTRAVSQQKESTRLWDSSTVDSWKLLHEVVREDDVYLSVTAENAFSPDGEYFASAWMRGHEVHIRRTENRAHFETIHLPNHRLSSFAWGRDSTSWIVGTTQAVVLIHRIGERDTKVFYTPSAIHHELCKTSAWGCRVALSHRGDRLVVGSGDGSLVVFSYPELELLNTLVPRDDDCGFGEILFDAADKQLLVS